MTGETFTGKQAAEMGLVNKAVPLERLREETVLGTKLAAKNAVVLARGQAWIQSDAGSWTVGARARLSLPRSSTRRRSRDPEHGREEGLKQFFLDEKSIKPGLESYRR